MPHYKAQGSIPGRSLGFSFGKSRTYISHSENYMYYLILNLTQYFVLSSKNLICEKSYLGRLFLKGQQELKEAWLCNNVCKRGGVQS